MNKKGFVLSTYVYILLVFFLLLLGTMLAVLNNSKLLSNKLKEQSGSTSGLLDNEYSFVLLGDKEINVMKDTEYEEPGYIAKTTKGVDISTYVSVIGNVDTSVENEYTLTYKITYNGVSRVLKRVVNVTTVTDFFYTEDYQIYEVPVTGYYKVELWGASGGNAIYGGKGAYTSGIIKLEKDEELYVYVGGEGLSNSTTTNVGGYNGGGYSGSNSGQYSYGGGGATDIRLVNGLWNDATGLNSRIMVSAGGAGSVNILTTNAGSGGGLIGGNGTSSASSYNSSTYLPTGATQTGSGFAYEDTSRKGSFGYAMQSITVGYAGGGGGGYYGGSNGFGTTGSGGSSFISGYAGVNAITSSSDRTHTNNTLHYSNKYFIDGEMHAGVNEGNGKAKITYIGNEYEKKNTNFDNVRYIKNCISGSTINTYKNWVELQAISDGKNVALGKSVYLESGDTLNNSAVITNGIIYPNDGSSNGYINDTSSLQCLIVDLGETYNLNEIAVWHNYLDNRTFYTNITYVSTNKSEWNEVMNKSETETSNGIRVSAYD